MCAEEAFEPDTPANPADPLAELRKANAGLYADLRQERERRHEAEKRAAFAERERKRTPTYKKERDEAIRLAQEAYAQLDRLVQPRNAEPAPQPDFHTSRVNAAAHALKSEPIPEPVGPAGAVDLLTERANELSEEIVENA